MSNNFEFDDNDDILLNAFGTPPSDNTTSEQHSNSKQENDENIPVKRQKLNESMSPVIKFSYSSSHAAKKNTDLRNNSLSSTVKRIFPGPAGILSDENQTDMYSQDTSSFFQDNAWEEMSKDFTISGSIHLYDKFNIAWIKKEATANKFANQKAPFLAGILLSLEVSEGHTKKSINVTLKDMTGTIQGTILQNLYEEYASHLTLGSVLVLTQFGVLSCTCDKCDNHHLTVTSKNLSAIYSGKEKIVIKDVDPEEALKEYYKREKELELTGIHKNLMIRQNSSRSPVLSSSNSSKCTLSNNRNMEFQSPCASKNILSTNIVNRTIKSTENTLQERCSSSGTFVVPKVRTIDKSISETVVVKKVFDSNSPTNLVSTSSASDKPKKLFSFKKVNDSPKRNISSESNSSPVTMDSSSGSQNIMPNHTKGNNNIDSINVSSVKIVNSSLSVKVDNVEHEKLWKDALEDVDVSSLFEDDF